MKDNKDSLGDRMKTYEKASRPYLTSRTPVICRLDGKAFHTFTKGCDKPFDAKLIRAMKLAAVTVANNIQGFKLAYIQSDEASFLLTDYDDISTQGWFNYNLSKMVSISASVMTASFNHIWNSDTFNHSDSSRLAYFDSRAFNIPEDEVANYFVWRSKDWARNSLQMYCRSFFSHKQLHGKNSEDMHNMLHDVGKNWTTDCLDCQKNGTFLVGKKVEERTNIMPNYQSISEVVDEVLAREED